MKENTKFVYVQAIPSQVLGHAKKWGDLGMSKISFRLSHSSKVALAKAKQSKNVKIVAIGYSSVLREAIVSGADEAIAVPLCDDPLAQAESIYRSVSESFTGRVVFMVGENLDGPFSGAALCGALSVLCDLGIAIDPKDDGTEERVVVLVKDDGSPVPNIDVRRIDGAFKKEIPESTVEGRSGIVATQNKKSDIIRGESAEEVALNIARRLRRLSR